MKKLILIFGTFALFTACKNNSTEKATTGDAATATTATSETTATPTDRLKSAIYETEMELPHGMGVTSTKVQFDDYGKKVYRFMYDNLEIGKDFEKLENKKIPSFAWDFLLFMGCFFHFISCFI